MKIAYLDAFSGISGDMTVGALVHLGFPLAVLRETLAGLALDAVEIAAERVERSGIGATKLRVHVHGGHSHAYRHEHRAWADIRTLLERAALAEPVRAAALAVFGRLAEAEGRVHGVPAERVEFHEVGELDAVVDVVGAAVGLRHHGEHALHESVHRI